MGDQSTGRVTQALARVAERHGDPAEMVYAELFRRYPDAEALFVLDRNGAVRGSMLANVFAVLMDLEADQRYGLNMLRAEMQTHDNLGVERARFFAFLDIVKASVAGVLSDEWTEADAREWDRLIALARTAAEEPVP